MQKVQKMFVFLLLATITVVFAGCGDDSTTTPAGFTVTTPSPLAAGTVGTVYGPVTLAASGGTGALTWSVPPATLPAGLALSTAGVITGTPTAAATTSFTVTVTDSATPTVHTATKLLSITVAAPATLTVTTPSPLAAGTVGAAYGPVTLAASGGTGALSWSVPPATLPAGLALSAAGVITGTPTAAATTNFTVTVTDSATPTVHTATKLLSITVNAAGAALTITTTSPLAAATFGTAYGPVTLAATGGTGALVWSVPPATLPAGLTLSAAGVISGTPTAPAVPNATTSTFTAAVTDAASGATSKSLAVTASLSVSAASGRATYDANCAVCHALGIYDVAGSPQLGGLGVATLTPALNARFAGGLTHQGRTLTATLITDMLNFLSLY